jgi:hypothetical protein
MPLVKGRSDKAFEHNIKAEIGAGKPQKQSLAIAYAMKRKAEHKADGGEMCAHGGPVHCMAGCYAGGGESSEQPAGPVLDPEKVKQFTKGFNSGDVSISDAVSNAKKALGFAKGGEMKSKRERAMEAFHRMAEGGESYKTGAQNARTYSAQSGQKGVHTPRMPYPKSKESYGESMAGYSAKDKSPALNAQAKGEHERVLGEMKSMKKPNLMAEGGYIGSYQSKDKPEIDGDLMPEAHLEQELAEHVAHMDAPDSHVEHAVMNQMGDEDEGAGDMDAIHPMVRRIMMGMAKGYSKGGMVANEDAGESASTPEHMAKDKENEFDDLALRDDLEFEDTGANLGDAAEDHDRNDIVSRIMKSRAKKDRMPRPA